MNKGRTLAALLCCYLIWGMQPVYWSFLRGFDPLFIMCARVLMSMLLCWIYLICAGRWRDPRVPVPAARAARHW